MRAALAASDAGRLVTGALSSDNLRMRPCPTWIVAAGKAAPAMATAAEHVLGGTVRAGVVIAVAKGRAPGRLEWIEGGHPLPDERSEHAGRRALEFAANVPLSERLLVLLSGGASAMMAVPADGLTLADKQAATARLLASGADIRSLNAVRKHLSAIKGGQLAAATRAESVTLAVSDVAGDDLSVIGSGPTVPDPSTFQEGLSALDRFGGRRRYPAGVVDRLTRGAAGSIAETPKAGDARLSRAVAHVIGGRADAMRGAVAAARALGYSAVQIDEPVTGEAREAARIWLDRVIERANAMTRPACVVSSGETTVRVRGAGRGGRNQEFALALVEALAARGERVAVASVGTDGVDGPTDAAGALVDSSTARRAAHANLEPKAFLNHNNAYEFFACLDDLVLTGATGTNVGDLQVFLLA